MRCLSRTLGNEKSHDSLVIKRHVKQGRQVRKKQNREKPKRKDNGGAFNQVNKKARNNDTKIEI